MASTILEPETDAEILATHEVMTQLRPGMTPAQYVIAIRRLMEIERYRLVVLVEDGQVCAVAGYRFMEMLYCGRIISIDDLVTDERARSQGFGRHLLNWLKAHGRSSGCAEIHLDSKLHRAAAHRFYEREELNKLGYHFSGKL